MVSVVVTVRIYFELRLKECCLSKFIQVNVVKQAVLQNLVNNQSSEVFTQKPSAFLTPTKGLVLTCLALVVKA